jgi:hypothetical protein
MQVPSGLHVWASAQPQLSNDKLPSQGREVGGLPLHCTCADAVRTSCAGRRHALGAIKSQVGHSPPKNVGSVSG